MEGPGRAWKGRGGTGRAGLQEDPSGGGLEGPGRKKIRAETDCKERAGKRGPEDMLPAVSRAIPDVPGFFEPFSRRKISRIP